jgi:predicted transcriptional regulator
VAVHPPLEARHIEVGPRGTICYDIVVTRTATLVQLNRDLLAALDQRATELGVSRSQVIREAIETYLAETLDAAIDREIVEAYTRRPQSEDPAWEASLRESITAEPW